ncbi:hypothetical protein THUN1379_26040 [Paludibacterium sp. THUN1379]|nr:hypothetical protein THUN1379_26040 [Paludibacterium sp. THUN1379]
MSLVELLLVLALMLVLAGSAMGVWRAQVIRVGQAEARLAMMQSARYLEQLYVRHQRYGLAREGSTWARLPERHLRYYYLDFGARQEEIPGRYRLIARPRYFWLGDEFLAMDQDGLIVVCRPVAGAQSEDCQPR